MTKLFEITRKDGRSNTQVVCDYVGHADPGRVFSYDELGNALSNGTSKPFSTQGVQAAIRIAQPKLGKLHKRTMHCVRRVGYRLAYAKEHMSLAVDRQSKASRQLKRGFEILRDTRFEEIEDPQARRAHEGQLLVISALLHASAAHEKRISRIENIIHGMLETATTGQT